LKEDGLEITTLSGGLALVNNYQPILDSIFDILIWQKAGDATGQYVIRF
jgi:hypothetical protein